jgi:hypothetical protein
VAHMGDRTSVYRVLVGTCGRKRPLGRPRNKWKVYIKMNLEEEHGVAWTGLIWLRRQTGSRCFWLH